MKSRSAQGLIALCALFAMSSFARADDLPAPYREMPNNLAYNAAFCDSEVLFKPKDAASAAPWQKTLFAAMPDAGAVRALAEDVKQVSCVRLFAYKWLREHSQLVPPKLLLGVVIEVPADEGLDTLAAYADGRVRYISHGGKEAQVEVPPAAMQDKSKALFTSSNKLVARIGAWNKKRLPPPAKGKVRISFLASDGLYFGEGSFAAIQKDADAAQVIRDGTELLQLVVGQSQ
ncbi:MAG: hypothetical protein JO002_15560 [Burkholderiaceae bacterium]|nr:hypothetical protein [Burkholderiaceae bacterium]